MDAAPRLDDPTPDEVAELDRLYRDFDEAGLKPLWTEIGDLMPSSPRSRARAHRWRWDDLLPLAEDAGRLVPVGRGGERRAIALVNPGLDGRPFATPTLWCAIQYLGPAEEAPAHRHSQSAFRFVVDGEGVWTNVNGDAVAMRRGDLLLTPGAHWHEHHNTTDAPMAWIDGLDIPLVANLDASFFEFGPDTLATRATPHTSANEALWGYPGLRPLGAPAGRTSPLMAYRWAHTDAALTAQLALADSGPGAPGPLGPGHAAVRYTNPATGGDCLPTMRCEFHRYGPGAASGPVRSVGSSVWQVFDGEGTVTVGDQSWTVARGDLFVVPSWQPLSVTAERQLDLFGFSDAPVYEALGLDRHHDGDDDTSTFAP